MDQWEVLVQMDPSKSNKKKTKHLRTMGNAARLLYCCVFDFKISQTKPKENWFLVLF